MKVDTKTINAATKSPLKNFANNVEPDVSIENQLAGKGQLRNLRNNPNIEDVDINEILRMTPREVEERFKGSSAGNDLIKQINKAFEGRDLGKGH